MQRVLVRVKGKTFGLSIQKTNPGSSLRQMTQPVTLQRRLAKEGSQAAAIAKTCETG